MNLLLDIPFRLFSQYVVGKITNLGSRIWKSNTDGALEQSPFSLDIDHPNFEGCYFAHYKVETIKQENSMSYYRDCSTLGMLLETVASSAKITEMDVDLKNMMVDIYKKKGLKRKTKSPFNLKNISEISNFHMKSLRNKLGKYVTKEERSIFNILKSFDDFTSTIDKPTSLPAVDTKPTSSAVDTKPTSSAADIKPTSPAVDTKPTSPAVDTKPISPAADESNGKTVKKDNKKLSDDCGTWMNIDELTFELLNALIFIKNEFKIDLSSCIQKYLDIILCLHLIEQSEIRAALSPKSLEYSEEYKGVFRILESAACQLQENFEDFNKQVNPSDFDELSVVYATNRYNSLIYMLRTLADLPHKFSSDSRLEISKYFLTELTTAFIHGMLSKTDLNTQLYSVFSATKLGPTILKKMENTFFTGLASLGTSKITNNKKFDQTKIYNVQELARCVSDVLDIKNTVELSNKIIDTFEYSPSLFKMANTLAKTELILRSLAYNDFCKDKYELMDDFYHNLTTNIIAKVKKNSKMEINSIYQIVGIYLDDLKDAFENSQNKKILEMTSLNVSIENILSKHSNDKKIQDTKEKVSPYKTTIVYLRYIAVFLIFANMCFLILKWKK